MTMSDVNKLSATEKSAELGLQSNPSSSTLTPTIDEKVQKKLVRKIDLLVLPALGMYASSADTPPPYTHFLAPTRYLHHQSLKRY
jgi:hypothetical protein